MKTGDDPTSTSRVTWIPDTLPHRHTSPAQWLQLEAHTRHFLKLVRTSFRTFVNGQWSSGSLPRLPRQRCHWLWNVVFEACTRHSSYTSRVHRDVNARAYMPCAYASSRPADLPSEISRATFDPQCIVVLVPNYRPFQSQHSKMGVVSSRSILHSVCPFTPRLPSLLHTATRARFIIFGSRH